MESINIITHKIIGCCFHVHNTLGSGFNEKAYHQSLILTLQKQSLNIQTEKPINIVFENIKVGQSRLDLVVEDLVIIEVKAQAGCLPIIFRQQLLSYLKASGLRIGLLVNFGNKSCEIKRFVV